MENKKYKVAIIDDESVCIENLHQSIAGYSELKLVGSVQLPAIGKELILKQKPDLLFLDVEMPRQSGLELLNEIRDQINWTMHVIFYTAYDKYLLEALRASAFDYLLKPYKHSDFNNVIDRFLTHLSLEKSKNTFQDSLLQLFPSDCPFMVPTATGYKMLRKEQIGYFEYQKEKKQWTVISVDLNRLDMKYNTLADDILKHSAKFVQISQRHIINIDYLSSIVGKDCHLFPPFNHESLLHISRNYLTALLDKFETAF